MLQRHIIHQQEFNINQQGAHPDFVGRLLYFLIPYVVLLIVSWIYYTRSLNEQMRFSIYPLPSDFFQKVIYFVVLAFIAATGIYVLLGDYWTAYAWILFAVSNILITLYIFLYQLGNKFALFLTALDAIALGVALQWLFIETAGMQSGFNNLVIRNFVGAVEAWGIFYALITIGQVIVHELSFGKKCQAIFFYILGILFLVLLTLWNKSKYAQWNELIGFIVVEVLLILLATFHIHQNSSKEIV